MASKNYIGATFSLNIKSLLRGAKESGESLEQLKSKFVSMRSGADAFKSNMDAAGAAASGFKTKIQDFSGGFSDINQKAEQLRAKLSQAKIDVEGFKAAQERVRAEYQQATAEVTKLKNEQSQLNTKIKEQSISAQDAKKAQEEINQKLKKAKDNQAQWKAKLQESSSELAKAKSKVFEIQVEQEKLNSSQEESTEKVSRLGKLYDGIKGKIGPIAGALGAVSVGAAFNEVKDVGAEYQQGSNNIAVSTGLEGQELDGLKSALKDIYSQNYGEGFQDIGTAIGIVAQQAKIIDSGEIKEMTIDALALRDAFDFDVSESVRTANMLMDQFGVSGTEAYNLIVQGAQNGLDKNGDLLDTINEYSVHFSQIGISAEGMFNSLINGAANGTWSVDKLGDAVKEFGIRVKDGTGDEAFAQLGLNAEELKAAFASGGAEGEKAFNKITTALFGMDDKVQQNLLGVQLFGTMWEDLGVEGVKALSDLGGEADRTYNSMEQLKSVKYDDANSALQGLGRVINTSLVLPISEKVAPAITDLVNKFATDFSEGGPLAGSVDSIANTIAGAFDAVGRIAEFVIKNWDSIIPVVKTAAGAFAAFKIGSGVTDGINKVKNLVDGVGKIKDVMKGVDFAKKFSGIGSSILGIVPKIGKAAAAFGGFLAANPIILAVVAGIAALVTIGVLVYKNWDTIKEKAGQCWNAIKGFFGGIGEWFSEKWNTVKEGAMNIWNGVTEKWSSIKDKAVDIWNGVSEKCGAAIDGIKGYIAPKLDSIKQAYEEHGGGLKGVAAAAMEGVKQYYSVGYDALNTLTGGKLDTVVNIAKEKFNAFKEKASGVWEGIKEKWGSAVDGISGYIGPKFGAVAQTFEEHGGGLKGAAAAAMEGVEQAYSVGFDALNMATGGKLATVTQGIQTGFQTMQTIGTTAFGAMQTAYQQAGGGVQGVFSAVMAGAQSIWQSGFDILNNITGGKAGEILASAQEKFNAVKDAISNAFTAAKDKVISIFESIKSKIASVWEGIKGIIKAPHIVQNGTITIAGISTPIPKLGIEWNAEGGIFSRPTVLPTMAGLQGFGEAGPEAVLPLNTLFSRLEQMWNQRGSSQENNVYHDDRNISINVYPQGRTSEEELNDMVHQLKVLLSNM